MSVARALPFRRAAGLGVMLLAGLAPGPAPASPGVLPFISDDYSRAVVEARARKVPIFVESWAPW